jgi:tetratricopeptide (TPR) repeat protein
MRTQRFFITWQAVALFTLGVAGVHPQELRTGAAVERRIQGGESHSYPIEARPGARLLVTVDQRGIDVVVEARRPDGKTLIAVDSPTDSQGPESALLPDEASGLLEIRVLAPSPGVAPGAYEIRLEELAEASPAERERVAAEQLMTEAAARNREGGSEGKRLAAVRYGEALVHWRALGQGREEARCRLALGGIDTALGQPQPALEHYQQALDRFAGLADEPGQAAAWSGIGLARTALGETAGAADAQRQALAIERRLGRLPEEAKALNNLGFALHSQGDLRAALGFYRQALDAFEKAGEQGFWKTNVLHNLAGVYIGLGEPDEALASHRQVLELQRALGDRRGEAPQPGGPLRQPRRVRPGSRGLHAGPGALPPIRRPALGSRAPAQPGCRLLRPWRPGARARRPGAGVGDPPGSGRPER